MKTKCISELISALAIGALFALYSSATHQKWHRLGREAFLAHESQNFDKLYANQASPVHLILIYTVITLSIFALYEGIAFVVTMALSAIAERSKTTQG